MNPTTFPRGAITIFTTMKNLLILASSCFCIFTAGFSLRNCPDEDLSYIENNQDTVSQTAQDCGLDFLFDSDLYRCTSCVTENSELRPSCSAYFGERLGYLLDNSLTLSLPFGNEAICQICLLKFCINDLNACAGIADNDLDRAENMFDCVDTNSSIYLNAPGTFEGIDKSCDGNIMARQNEEELDSNLAVSVIDLGILLLDIERSNSNYLADLTGDVFTKKNDISVSLTSLGANCV